MKLQREFTSKIRFLMDEFLPPILRDWRFLMILPFKLLYKNKAHIFMDFKNKANKISDAKFAKAYKQVSQMDSRITDLTEASLKGILANMVGKTVLDAGCGKGYLSEKLSNHYKVTACDILINKELIENNPKIKFVFANVEKLPFANREFDTVVCTHMLEHVKDIFSAVNELRRVTKLRLIVVVPKQRPYRFTFDLHLHFFPYAYSLMAIMNPSTKNDIRLKEIDGDWLYVENIKRS